MSDNFKQILKQSEHPDEALVVGVDNYVAAASGTQSSAATDIKDAK
jgi:hypothetical protein